MRWLLLFGVVSLLLVSGCVDQEEINSTGLSESLENDFADNVDYFSGYNDGLGDCSLLFQGVSSEQIFCDRFRDYPDIISGFVSQGIIIGCE